MTAGIDDPIGAFVDHGPERIEGSGRGKLAYAGGATERRPVTPWRSIRR